MSQYTTIEKYGKRTRKLKFKRELKVSPKKQWRPEKIASHLSWMEVIEPLENLSNIALVGYEMIIANSALRASLAIYHLISNARSLNNR